MIRPGTDRWMKIDEQASLAGVQRDITRLSARWPLRYRFLVLTRRDKAKGYELYLKHRNPQPIMGIPNDTGR